jgi:hypothetical protein
MITRVIQWRCGMQYGLLSKIKSFRYIGTESGGAFNAGFDLLMILNASSGFVIQTEKTVHLEFAHYRTNLVLQCIVCDIVAPQIYLVANDNDRYLAKIRKFLGYRKRLQTLTPRDRMYGSQ